MSDLFFYIGEPPEQDHVPEEYEAPEARDGKAPRPELASLITSIEKEIQLRGLCLDEVFEDAALRENASTNGLYLIFFDTPEALDLARKAVRDFGTRVGVQCFDPLTVGPADNFEAPVCSVDAPLPPLPGL